MSVKNDRLLKDKTILITDGVHDLLIDGLQELGADVDYHPKMPYENVKAVVSQYDGIVINSKVICDADFLEKNKHLEFISRLGSGLDIIDLSKAAELKISVISTPDGNANAVAEHAMGMLLMLLNNIHIANAQVKTGEWLREPNRGVEIRDKTIGVVGVGHTGGYFVEKLAGWRCEVLCYDKYRHDVEERYPYAKQCDLSTLFEKSEIISIHLPLTDETFAMIDDGWLAQCRPGVIIINTARGKIIKTHAIIEALESGQVGGACLDVLEQENIKMLTEAEREMYARLWSHPRTVMTPHIAGWTHESLLRIARITLQKITEHYSG